MNLKLPKIGRGRKKKVLDEYTSIREAMKIIDSGEKNVAYIKSELVTTNEETLRIEQRWLELKTEILSLIGKSIYKRTYHGK